MDMIELAGPLVVDKCYLQYVTHASIVGTLWANPHFPPLAKRVPRLGEVLQTALRRRIWKTIHAHHQAVPFVHYELLHVAICVWIPDQNNPAKVAKKPKALFVTLNCMDVIVWAMILRIVLPNHQLPHCMDMCYVHTGEMIMWIPNVSPKLFTLQIECLCVLTLIFFSGPRCFRC